jgi:hypothetical protein
MQEFIVCSSSCGESHEVDLKISENPKERCDNAVIVDSL